MVPTPLVSQSSALYDEAIQSPFNSLFVIPVSSAVLRVRMSKSMNTNTSLCRVFVSIRC